MNIETVRNIIKSNPNFFTTYFQFKLPQLNENRTGGKMCEIVDIVTEIWDDSIIVMGIERWMRENFKPGQYDTPFLSDRGDEIWGNVGDYNMVWSKNVNTKTLEYKELRSGDGMDICHEDIDNPYLYVLTEDGYQLGQENIKSLFDTIE
jgi:hypothetical protein